ncbi:MAG: hypothetical protein COA49_05510 [Bacteroidetes bacterium]|nr:MAG: hypothetical protein COA49_05510 [Bacteroidota bacterium]
MHLLCNMTEVIISRWHHQPYEAKSKRLQEAAIGQFDELPSRKSVKKAIVNGHVFVNGIKGTTATFVKLNDIVSYNCLEEIHGFSTKNIGLNIPASDIVWEDDYIACVIKRGGIITKGNYKVTLEKQANKHLIINRLIPDSMPSSIAIHRLDKATHGPVLFAKTLSAASNLSDAFSNRKIIKTYIALIEGEPLFSSSSVQIKLDDKEAISNITILGTIKWPIHVNATLVKVLPITGRTHQIRRHLASIGHPIVGDYLYGQSYKYHGQGLFLACTGLNFKHPITDESILIEVNLPRKFKKITRKLCLP